MPDVNQARVRSPSTPEMNFAAAEIAYAANKLLSRVSWVDGRAIQLGEEYLFTADDKLATDWFEVL
jgi:hypothetical protein